jgi:hypothetical protein
MHLKAGVAGPVRDLAGYVAAVIGALVGAVGGAFAGYAAGAWYVDRFMPGAELESLLPPLVGAMAASVVGAGLGTWLALALSGRMGAGVTGGLTALLVPLIPILFVILFENVMLFQDVSPQWLLGLALGMVAGAALLARGLTSVLERRELHTWKSGPLILWIVAAGEVVVAAQLLTP